MRKTCETVIVGGLSTGAVLALLLAARNPKDVHGTALLFAPTFWLNGWLIPWYARLFRIISNKRIANLIGFPDLHPHGIKDERIRDFIRNALFSGDGSVAGLPSTPGGAVLEHRLLVNAVKREIGNVHQPSLIMHPREDDYADLDNAWYLQRESQGFGRHGGARRQLPHRHRRPAAARGGGSRHGLRRQRRQAHAGPLRQDPDASRRQPGHSSRCRLIQALFP